jgi:crotonobetainyl-CoA:carnitine CoA-transferase CaiB-like acyl-CoA transferase
MTGPLNGVKVFDLTVWMVGPWASMQLGSLGADVIHIEQPGVPLSALGAGVPPTINGTSVGYVTWNMNKRGLALDLKREEGRQTAYDVIKTCDVFLINMRPGVAKRLGVDYETLKQINPSIIYCSLTGWGETGPMIKRPGADGQIQGFSGFWSINGQEGEEGEFYRHFAQLDAITGNYAAQAILMSLLSRKKSGEGQFIEVPMIKAAVSVQQLPIFDFLQTGEIPKPIGSRSRWNAPDQVFLCEDMNYIGISVTSDDEWHSFCKVLDRRDLTEDENYKTNYQRLKNIHQLVDLLNPIFIKKPLIYWLRVLSKENIPCGYSLRFEHLKHHTQVVENKYIVQIETDEWGRLYTGGPPWHFSKTPAEWRRPPLPGEHSDEIIAETRKEMRP